MGLWKLRRDWETTVDLQLRLDRCAGEAAGWVRGSIEATEASNHRMRTIRASLSVASILPPARAALQAALEAEGALQIARSLAWKSRKLRWSVLPCPETAQVRPENTFPEDPWLSLPRDGIGPKPRKWNRKENAFEFRVHSPPQRSLSRLERKTNVWFAAWREPGGASPH